MRINHNEDRQKEHAVKFINIKKLMRKRVLEEAAARHPLVRHIFHLVTASVCGQELRRGEKKKKCRKRGVIVRFLLRGLFCNVALIRVKWDKNRATANRYASPQRKDDIWRGRSNQPRQVKVGRRGLGGGH